VVLMPGSKLPPRPPFPAPAHGAIPLPPPRPAPRPSHHGKSHRRRVEVRKIDDLAAWQAHARVHGFRRYVQRPGSTVRAIWESERCTADEASPYIREVYSEDRFGRVVSKLRWVERRRKGYARVESAVAEAMKAKVVMGELGRRGDLERARDALLHGVLGQGGNPKARPRSAEGVVAALVRLDARISTKRRTLTPFTATTGAAPPGAVVPPGLAGAAGFTEAEIEAMAAALAARLPAAGATATGQPSAP
jgi:hypothetical protein